MQGEEDTTATLSKGAFLLFSLQNASPSPHPGKISPVPTHGQTAQIRLTMAQRQVSGYMAQYSSLEANLAFVTDSACRRLLCHSPIPARSNLSRNESLNGRIENDPLAMWRCGS